jgi:hypothetical protein
MLFLTVSFAFMFVNYPNRRQIIFTTAVEEGKNVLEIKCFSPKVYTINQCCGSGSGIRVPGSGAFLTPGSGIRNR